MDRAHRISPRRDASCAPHVNLRPAIIRADGVGRDFRDLAETVVALRNVSFAVERGEFVALEGPSGSGKSTLLHLIAGLDVPSQGTLVVAGHDMHSLNDDQRATLRRSTIGVVLPIVQLNPTLSLWENVALPALLNGGRLRAGRERAEQTLKRVGLSASPDRPAGRLSSGEAQRTCVARALFAEPALLLADEPTSTLDSVRSDELLALLRSLADAGQTILLATHNPRAAAYTDRSLRLLDGRLVPAPA